MAALCFLPAGNCLRIVSYSAWLHCVSYRQETIREGFPTRLGSTVFLADRKLFAKGFLPGVTLWRFLPAGNCSKGDFSTPLRYARNDRGGVVAWCFLPAGNYSRRVSCSAWLHCVSCWQETIREGFPTRLGSTVFLADRKLFAKGFLLDVAPLCFLPTGNCLRRVSCSTWLHCVSYRQETVCEGFPARRGSTVFLADRKLFVYSFLLDLALWCFLPTGNFSQRVSCSTWLHCVSCRQETVCEGFPTRRGSTVFLTGRKLLDRRFLDSASLRSK